MTLRDNIQAIFREFTKRDPSSEEIDSIVHAARLTNCSQDDPGLGNIVMSCTTINALKDFPGVVKKIISDFFEVKIVENVVAQIGQNVKDAVREVASEEMSKVAKTVEKKNKGYRIMVDILMPFIFLISGALLGANYTSKSLSVPTIQLAGASLGASSLFDAINDENTWLLRKLISVGVNPNVENRRGDTPLLVAVKQNANIDVITALLEGKADVNAMDADYLTPLLHSIMKTPPNLEAISALIEKGADVNAQHSKEGFTLLMLAAHMNDSATLITMLVQASADISVKNRDSGKIALVYAKENPALKDNPDVLRLLGEKPEPVKPAPAPPAPRRNRSS